MQSGILAVGAYVPRLRLARSAIASAHKWMAPALVSGAKGCRAFCSHDEDAVTMAVEAVRDCIPPRDRNQVAALSLASTTLPYADMSNGAIVAAATDLPKAVRASESTGSQRAGSLALIAALRRADEDAVVVASERGQAKPASTFEMQFGAGAAAFRIGPGEAVAHYLGSASSSASFPDHVRAADSEDSYFWEERFIRDEGYRLIPPVVGEALVQSGVAIADISHFVMPSLLRGGAGAVAKAIGYKGQIADDLASDCGHAGAAHGFLMLAKVLETANAGERILFVTFGQGVDAIVLQATGKSSPGRGVSGCLADRIETQDYLRFLSFYGRVDLDWGMRAEVQEKAALTNAWRSSSQVLGFRAGKCPHCQTVQFPQLSVCVSPGCGSSSTEFEQISLADEPAKVLTYTADWLSYHPAPPLFAGFVQFANGARLMMETCDTNAEIMDVGVPLRMVFRARKTDPRSGFRRYFWKATPLNS